MTDKVTVIGVRHHSPACARLVRHVLQRERPEVVLIEGPSDMNGARLGELLLPHQLPVALFTWSQAPEGRVHGVWSPFCETSPEWVALHTGAQQGALVEFIDLPAWHRAFDDSPNRYSDRHLRASDRLFHVAKERGFDSVDALWDHLFEGPQALDALEEKLRRYFDMLRGDEAPEDGDALREAFMRQHIERHAGRRVVVVCGGFHANALTPGSSIALPPPPAFDVPEGAKVGSALIPFSFHRLDAFAGYASGLPSPAWYQCLFERGHEEAPDVMLLQAVARLRSKQQPVSAADVIAARTMMEGLARLRGHDVPARLDVLDALAAALVKDALDAPLPWTRRGPLPVGTSPFLVELVAAFSGDRVGALAPGTPQPPLTADALSALAEAGVTFDVTERLSTMDLTTENGKRSSRVLHRLRLIGVAGVMLKRGADFSRRHTWLKEEWRLRRSIETDASLVEASRFGGTLETAAAFAISQRLTDAPDAAALAQALVEAAQAGLAALEQQWLDALVKHVADESSAGTLGEALRRLLQLRHGEAVLGSHGATRLDEVLKAMVSRLTWLLEGITGATAPYDAALVGAVVVLKQTAHEEGLVELPAANAMALRLASHAEVPPCLRGAALGFAWTSPAPATDDAAVVTLVKGAALPATFGDFLAGLFAVAQRVPPAVLSAIDAAVSQLPRDDFFLALPSLRLAFSYFAPAERLRIAETLLATAGETKVDPMSLLKAPVQPAVVQAGFDADARAWERALKYGLVEASP